MAYTLSEVASKVRAAGGRIFLVGGAVRDQMMNLSAKDQDYCVTGLSEAEFMELFPDAVKTGESFPVYRLKIDNEECEVALARKERKLEGHTGHQAFVIEIDKAITIEDDLARRDLSFNAMALEIDHGGQRITLIDPYGGQSSIVRKEVSAIFLPALLDDVTKSSWIENGIYYKNTNRGFVKSNFTEDPLRLYRALRFASRYEYTITQETKEMMQAMEGELKSLSAERVYDELCKVMQTKKPSTFFNTLKSLGLLHIHFDAWKTLSGSEFGIVMRAIDSQTIGSITEQFAVLLIYFKREMICKIAEQIKMPTIVRDLAAYVSVHHLEILNFENLTAEVKVGLVEAVRRHPLTKQIESALEPTGEKPTAWVHCVMNVVAQSYGYDTIKTTSSLKAFEEVYQQLQQLKLHIPITLTGKEIGEYIREEKIKTIKNKPI